MKYRLQITMTTCFRSVLVSLLAIMTTLFTAERSTASDSLPGIYSNWKTYYSEDIGLPSDHIFALKSAGDSLWVGTEEGLARYKNSSWKSWTQKDGLPWSIITGIDISRTTGDVWLATFGGGLVRFTGGRFDQFTQLNSGLVNDVIYGVAVSGSDIWAATAAGISTYNTITGQWRIFNEKNAPMEEIWCYNIDADGDKVYVAVWGGGILVYDKSNQRWDAHRDPDGEMEIDLYRDDGLVHNITTSVSTVGDTMWAASYFGLSRYDGRHWRGYLDHDSGLISNFINYAIGLDENSCLVATDQGLSILTDASSDSWVTYRKEDSTDKTWTAMISHGKNTIAKEETNLTLPNHFIITVAMHQDELWLGTGHGLARGKKSKPQASINKNN